MNTAYNTFLTALVVEYYHDHLADNITNHLNVTWSRTSPIIVSVGEDAYQIYMTLECDHSMGMTVVGQPANMYVFNYITSLYISPIEYIVMNSAYNATFSSVSMELIYTYYNYNTYVETFEENGFVIIKSLMNDNLLVIDLETGIIRDINTVNNLFGGTGESGEGYVFKESTQCIGCITWMGFLFYHWQVPNPWDLGTYQFEWNGAGRVYISGNGMFLVDISADNKLTIIGPNGEKIVEGTQGALDITDILDKDGGLQTLHLILEDKDGYFIGTSPLYIVQKTLEKQELNLPLLFPIPWVQNTIDEINNHVTVDINWNALGAAITNEISIIGMATPFFEASLAKIVVGIGFAVNSGLQYQFNGDHWFSEPWMIVKIDGKPVYEQYVVLGQGIKMFKYDPIPSL